MCVYVTRLRACVAADGHITVMIMRPMMSMHNVVCT